MKTKLWVALIAAAGCLAGTSVAFAASPTKTELEPTIAIGVLLEPDEKMAAAAKRINARLRSAYGEGFALDESHVPHLTLLQCYVHVNDMDRVSAAVARAIRETNLPALRAHAAGLDDATWSGLSMISMAVEDSRELRRLHERITWAVAPFAVPAGTTTSFVTDPGAPGINSETIAYVRDFIPKKSGVNFKPHVTAGVAPKSAVEEVEAEPFTPFEFGTRAVAIYQLGNHGTARKRLWRSNER